VLLSWDHDGDNIPNRHAHSVRYFYTVVHQKCGLVGRQGNELTRVRPLISCVAIVVSIAAWLVLCAL
jgi:hypothetical protein